jgi:phosphotransferase system enzyme I (PtsP)
VGADKILSYYDNVKEPNPFLGLRSIRFSLRHKDIFVQQVRAILRAGAISPVQLMFPMISSLDEFHAARTVVVECMEQLEKDGIPHMALPQIGVMIELPSAVEMADDLAREAAFFSVGTNDLIQYMLAVDRTNQNVADLYVPHHPSVLRALKRIADAALKYDRSISVCGDMAHDTRYVSFLIGIGIRSFSLDARYLPRIQERLAAIDLVSAQRFAARLLAMDGLAAIEKELAL